jgi:hypothetical protein
MKKRILIGALIVIVGIGLIFAMSGCDAIFESLVESASSVSGTVIDARDADASALSGMNLTLTSISDSTYSQTATTSTDGSFTFDGLDPDKSPYTITGTGTKNSLTYTLIKQTVKLDGLFKSLGNIPALAISVEDATNYAFTYILMWPKEYEETTYDLDLHMSFNTAYNDPGITEWNLNQADTYYDNEANRERVYYRANYRQYPSTGDAKIILDVDSRADDNLPGVETISLRQIPDTSPGTYNINSGDVTTFLGDYSYAWMGHADIYVNLFRWSASSDYATPESAKLSDVDPVVYVIQSYFESDETDKVQSNAKADLLGIFPLPDTSVKDSAKMLRTDMFYDDAGFMAYILSWDGEFLTGPDYDQYTFKSVAGSQALGVRAE